MIIVPASMGSVGRIAAGISQTLIERAADVMLKERRRLVIVVRETPYSLIHLRNMTTLTEAGAVILPASPSFYSNPETILQAVDTVVERIMAHTGIKAPHYEFIGREGK
jgi:4-hydroxy-3-polyprenylbenzoate decarboxylase